MIITILIIEILVTKIQNVTDFYTENPGFRYCRFEDNYLGQNLLI